MGSWKARSPISGIARFRWLMIVPARSRPITIPAGRRWYHYDLEQMAATLGLELAPIVVEADDTANPGGLPIGGRTRITLANNHLQYAITWYGLAATLIGVYIVFRRPEPGAARAGLTTRWRT